MSEFVDYLSEVFEPFGMIRVRRMFGGFGVYHNSLMFALVEDDVLYLKADEQSVRFFEDKGLAQFQYHKKGQPVKMSYYMAPEEIFEDPEAAEVWALRAYEAAVRSQSMAER